MWLGQKATMGSRVPPRWEPKRLPHWKGVLLRGPGRPAYGVVGLGHGAAELIESGEHGGGGFGDSVYLGHAIGGAVEAAFQAGPVVSGDVEDEGVVELAGGCYGVDDAAELVVALGSEAGVDLHETSGYFSGRG